MTVSPEKIAEMLAATEGVSPGARVVRYSHAPAWARVGLATEDDTGFESSAEFREDAAARLYSMIDPETLRSILTELTTLRSQLSGITEETSSWQPIETAPKDGTTILMGKWHDGERYWIASGCIEDGKYWCDFPDDYFAPFSHQNPTHWRPIGAHP